MHKLTLWEFVNNNFDELVTLVSDAYGVVCETNGELREWVLNDETLYEWAKFEGVRADEL